MSDEGRWTLAELESDQGWLVTEPIEDRYVGRAETVRALREITVVPESRALQAEQDLKEALDMLANVSLDDGAHNLAVNDRAYALLRKHGRL